MRNDLITVERYDFNPNWTIGRSYIFDELFGFVMEDEIRVKKVKGETAIPFGRYALGHRYSPKFSHMFLWSEKAQLLIPHPLNNPRQYRNTQTNRIRYDKLRKLYDDWTDHQLIWIMNVPNFEYVLLHVGNTERETDGCLLVGSPLGIVNGREAVLHSQAHYMELYPRIFPLVQKGGQFINIVKAAA